MSVKQESIILNIIKWGVVAILLLPLFVYKGVLYPYIFSKALLFQLIVEILLVFWLYLRLFSKNKEKYTINWKNPLVFTLTAFMGVLLISAIFGANFYKSFYSTQERMTGLLTMYHFYGLFLIIISCFKKEKYWKLFLWASLISSFLVGLYGLGQKLGIDFLLKGGLKRMSSTLGNPDFLGVYAMMHVFLGSFLFLKQKKVLNKIIVLFLLVFNLAIMLLTGTRASLLAFAFALVSFLIYLIFQKKTKNILRFSIIAFLILIIGFFVFIRLEKDSNFVKNSPVAIKRLANTSLKGSKARLLSWQIGLKGFLDRPVLGWGIENYNLVFNKFYNPWNLTKGVSVTWFDKSHNQVIDLLSLSGALGTLIYILMFGAIFWILFKKKKNDIKLKQEDGFNWQRLVLALMFLAYFIQNLFVFDTPAPLIVFYLSLGLVYFVSQSKTIDKDNKIKKDIKKPSFPLPVFIVLAILFLIISIYNFNFQPLRSSRLGAFATTVSEKNLKTGFDYFKKSLKYPNFTSLEIRRQLAKRLTKEYNKKDLDPDILIPMTEFAISEYEKSAKTYPKNARVLLYLGTIYNLAFKYRDSYVDDAKKVLEKGLNYSPKRQQIYFELAKSYVIEKNYKKGLEIYKQGVELEPRARVAKNGFKQLINAIKEKDPEIVKPYQKYLKSL
ncbi:MAG TPA: O-antigen ligase family protein [Patescibacteria group bacterium]|nr:O-antigen ligase family protein [Patescibacteria group bacterium]